MSEEKRTALTAPGTPDELYGTIISLVDKGIKTIEENIDWFLGKRKSPPSTYISSFYHPTEGHVMEAFRLTANSLIRFGLGGVSLHGSLLATAREKSTFQLARLSDLIDTVAPSLSPSETWLLHEIVRFFTYATDSFFGEIESRNYWWLTRLSKGFEVDCGLVIAFHAIKRFHVTFLACERQRQGMPAEPPDCSPLFKFMLVGITRVAYPIFNKVSTLQRRGVGPLIRGPKETKMMERQRNALIVYVVVELHKNIKDVSRSDAFHVWNLRENVDIWNEAAMRKDERRGYKTFVALYGVVKSLAQKNKLDITKITAV